MEPTTDRLSPEMYVQLREMLAAVGLTVREGEEAEQWFADLRHMYEPYMTGLTTKLLFTLPPWLPSTAADDWQTTAWEWNPAQMPPVRTGEVVERS